MFKHQTNLPHSQRIETAACNERFFENPTCIRTLGSRAWEIKTVASSGISMPNEWFW